MLKPMGFTIIETLIVLAILSSLIAVGTPYLNNFIVGVRVDNEISTLRRLILIARNSALTYNSKVTLCPLNSQNRCINLWHNELSVFTDTNNNKIYEPILGEKIIAVKGAIKIGDKLQYGKTRIGLTYAATGHLAGWGQNATFSYCPRDYDEKSRGVIVATSGRSYVSSANKKYTANVRRSGRKIVCN